jgi:hypothetical protein
VTEEEITDDEFGDRLLDLLITCQALSLSLDLFRIIHHDTMPTQRLRSERRLLNEGARALVGLWHLHQAEVELDEPASMVVVRAVQHSETGVEDPRSHLPCALMLATLFSSWRTIQLTILEADGSQRVRVLLPTDAARTYSELPEEAHVFGVLRVLQFAEIEPNAVDEVERYRSLWITTAARLVMQEVSALQPLRVSLPRTAPEYVATTERVLRNLKILREMLRATQSPPSLVRERNRMFEAIRLLRQGLEEHRTLVCTGRWSVAQRASPALARGAEILVELSGG